MSDTTYTVGGSACTVKILEEMSRVRIDPGGGRGAAALP
jgi:hypothetical protein